MNANPWTDHGVALLQKLWAEGATAVAMIGVAFASAERWLNWLRCRRVISAMTFETRFSKSREYRGRVLKLKSRVTLSGARLCFFTA